MATDFKENWYSTKEVIKITGICQRKLINWCETGLIVPARNAKGAGSRRAYSDTNLLEILIVNNLLSFGIHAWKVKQIIGQMRSQGEKIIKEKSYSILEGYIFLTISLRKMRNKIGDIRE